MKLRFFSLLVISLTIFIANPAFAFSSKPIVYNCAADPTWFPNPSAMPTEVKTSNPDGTSTFCDFYQFSYHAFLYLMSPNSGDASKRNFQVNSDYHILEFNADGSPENSCDDTVSANTLRTALDKSQKIPEIIHQAGDGATIYDQNGNVVYYEVRFSKNMCNVSSIKLLNNFPTGSTEIKLAWKVLDTPSANNYITMTADIGTQKNVLLGLVGFHLAIATTDHPEFVWSTFEHNNNSPDCTKPSRDTGWLFASETCTQALINNDTVIIDQCKFNTATSQTNIKGSPTEICREYPYGTDISDPNAVENLGDVTSLNRNVDKQLTGSMSVLKNYFHVGALWVSHINESSNIANQRGSLRLANTVAETTFQDVNITPGGFISNCFGCHGYIGKDETFNKNTTSGGLSHIFDDIAAGLGQCIDVQAGPLFNQSDAENKCPSTCTAPLGKWNGQWKTTKEGIMSVCGCCPP